MTSKQPPHCGYQADIHDQGHWQTIDPIDLDEIALNDPARFRALCELRDEGFVVESIAIVTCEGYGASNRTLLTTDTEREEV